MLDRRSLLNQGGLVVRLAARGVATAAVLQAIQALRDSRAARTRLDELRCRSNTISARRATARHTEGEDGEALLIKKELGLAERAARHLEVTATELVEALPNVPCDETPPGMAEEDDVVLSTYEGRPPPAEARPHWDIADGLNLWEPRRAVKVSGSGFAVLRGAGARLLKALIDLGLDLHRDAYDYVIVPELVHESAMRGSGHIPRFKDGAFALTEKHLWASPTAEVPLLALHSGDTLEESELPLKYITAARCFRREVGGGGAGSRGMVRLHEYHQVELTRICSSAQSKVHFERLCHDAASALVALNVRHRSVEVCAGRLPFPAARARRLDAFAPGLGAWLPVSTVTLSTDFQTRRASVRLSSQNGRGHPHSMNASAVAASRLWAVVLETYQDSDGNVLVPEVLERYLGAGLLA